LAIYFICFGIGSFDFDRGQYVQVAVVCLLNLIDNGFSWLEF